MGIDPKPTMYQVDIVLLNHASAGSSQNKFILNIVIASL